MSRTTTHSAKQGFGAARRERERLQREESVLAAAESVIARKGFHDAGMTEIAREAEYAIGTLYTLFPSKEALFERLIVSRTEELATSMDQALASPGSPRQRLEAALEAKIAHVGRHLNFVLIYASTSVTAICGWGAPARAERLRERLLERVAEVVRPDSARSEPASDADPMDIAIAFQTLSTQFLLATARESQGFDPNRVRRAMRTVFFQPLFRDAKAATGARRAAVARRARSGS